MKQMDIIIEAYKSLPEEQRKIFYKYMGIMPALVANVDNCQKVLTFAQENGIELITAKSLARFLAEDISTIEKHFMHYKKAGYERIILANPELIRFDAEEVLKRINQCIKAGKGIEIDGRFAEFLFDDLQWKNVRENLHLEEVSMEDLEKKGKDIESVDLHVSARIPNKESYKDLELKLFANDPLDLNPEQFERYLEISNLLKNVRESLYGVNADAENVRISSDMVISKLIGNVSDITPDNNLSNKDIVKACLYYCNRETNLDDGIDKVIDNLAVSQENKRGL